MPGNLSIYNKQNLFRDNERQILTLTNEVSRRRDLTQNENGKMLLFFYGIPILKGEGINYKVLSFCQLS